VTFDDDGVCKALATFGTPVPPIGRRGPMVRSTGCRLVHLS